MKEGRKEGRKEGKKEGREGGMDLIHEASTSILDQLPTRAPAFIDINSLPDEVQGK